jgi:hypothetical protein
VDICVDHIMFSSCHKNFHKLKFKPLTLWMFRPCALHNVIFRCQWWNHLHALVLNMPFTNGVALSYVIFTTWNAQWSFCSQYFCMSSNHCTIFFSSTTFKICSNLNLTIGGLSKIENKDLGENKVEFFNVLKLC